MWRNPKYFPAEADAPQRDEAAAAPEPTGRLLAAFPRTARGVRQELRVSLDEYEGHPYVSVRLWEEGRGRWWPMKGKGVSVRIGELAGVSQALVEALGLALAEGVSPAPRPRPPATQAGDRRPRDQGPTGNAVDAYADAY